MFRQPAPSPERDSIFGDTYRGVPNPNVVLEHGYPTRYHGPIFTLPQQGFTWKPATWAKAPFLGYEGQPQAVITSSLTGNRIADALLAAAAGYFGAPAGADRFIHAGVGALVGGLLGTVGILGLLSWELYASGAPRAALEGT